MPVNELFKGVASLINQRDQTDSRTQKALVVIIPAIEQPAWEIEARKVDLQIKKRLFITPKTGKKANRIAIEFTNLNHSVIKDEYITLRNENQSFTDEYQLLTKDFYLKF